MAKTSDVTIKINADPSNALTGIAAVDKAFYQMGWTMRTLGRELSFKLTLPIGALAVAAGKFAIDFEHSFAEVRTLLIGSTYNVKLLERELKKLATEVPQSLTTLTEGLYQILSANIKVADSMALLKESSKLATAGITDTGTATKVLASILNAYKLPITEASRVSDILFTGVKVGVFRFDELSEALGTVLSYASMVNIPLEELIASLAAVTLSSQNVRMATVGLNQVLRAYIDPTEGAKKVAREYGFQLNAATLQSRGLAGASKDLAALYDRVTEAGGDALNTIAQLVPEVRAMRFAASLAGSQFDVFNDILKEMKTNVGVVDDAFKIMAGTVKSEAKLAFEEFRQTAMQFGDDFMPLMHSLITLFSDFMKVMREWSHLTRGVTTVFATILFVLGPVLSFLGYLAIGFNALLPLFAKLRIAFLGITASTLPVLIFLALVWDDLMQITVALQDMTDTYKKMGDFLVETTNRMIKSSQNLKNHYLEEAAAAKKRKEEALSFYDEVQKRLKELPAAEALFAQKLARIREMARADEKKKLQMKLEDLNEAYNKENDLLVNVLEQNEERVGFGEQLIAVTEELAKKTAEAHAQERLGILENLKLLMAAYDKEKDILAGPYDVNPRRNKILEDMQAGLDRLAYFVNTTQVQADREALALKVESLKKAFAAEVQFNNDAFALNGRKLQLAEQIAELEVEIERKVQEDKKVIRNNYYDIARRAAERYFEKIKSLAERKIIPFENALAGASLKLSIATGEAKFAAEKEFALATYNYAVETYDKTEKSYAQVLMGMLALKENYDNEIKRIDASIRTYQEENNQSLLSAIRETYSVILTELFNSLTAQENYSRARYELDQIYLDKEQQSLRDQLSNNEISRKEYNLRISELDAQRRDNEQRYEADHADAMTRIWNGLKNAYANVLQRMLENFLYEKTSELFITKTTEAGKTAATQAGTAARIAAFLLETATTLVNAAASIANAIAKLIASFATIPFGLGLPLAAAAAGALIGMWSAFKGKLGFAEGGLFKGMGTDRSDSNIIAVSNGEYIVSSKGVRKNLPLLEAINSGRDVLSDVLTSSVRGYASGGLVSSSGNSLGVIQEIRGLRDALNRMSPVINITATAENRIKGRDLYTLVRVEERSSRFRRISG